MSEGKQPDRKKRTYIRKFDLIGELLENYGDMTGGNIVREIFSYLDFSTLQRGLLVANSWNNFLANDKKIWLDVLEKQLPNLIHFTNKLAENEEENSTFWKEVWSSIEKDDNKGPKELIDTFKRVQHIFEIVEICAKSKLAIYNNFHTVDYLPFHDDFVGEKVKKESRREIKKNENLFKPLLGDWEGHNSSQIIANLLGFWNRNLHYNPNIYNRRNCGRRIGENILVEIKKYLLNE